MALIAVRFGEHTGKNHRPEYILASLGALITLLAIFLGCSHIVRTSPTSGERRQDFRIYAKSASSKNL